MSFCQRVITSDYISCQFVSEVITRIIYHVSLSVKSLEVGVAIALLFCITLSSTISVPLGLCATRKLAKFNQCRLNVGHDEDKVNVSSWVS